MWMNCRKTDMKSELRTGESRLISVEDLRIGLWTAEFRLVNRKCILNESTTEVRSVLPCPLIRGWICFAYELEKSKTQLISYRRLNEFVPKDIDDGFVGVMFLNPFVENWRIGLQTEFAPLDHRCPFRSAMSTSITCPEFDCHHFLNAFE
jgi:hypothetical protein